jgi:type I restriction enzyme M protein
MARTTKSKNSQPLTTAQRLSSIVKSCRDIMRKDKGLNGDRDEFLSLRSGLESSARQKSPVIHN